MPHANLGDVSIYYEEAGSGPATYIFCHGLGGSCAGFVETDLAFWSQHFRTIAWDNRGLGKSSAAEKYSAPLYAYDLMRLMDQLGVERAKRGEDVKPVHIASTVAIAPQLDG
jgi:pimeloyl-ACP methyl ester carboxylesterase